MLQPRIESSGSPLASEAEARINEVVRRAVAQGGGGAQRILAGRKIAPLTYREAMQRTLQHNLNVQFQQQVTVEADAVVQGKKAAFDPVIGILTSYLRNSTYNRTDVITRVRRPFPDFAQFEQQFQQQLQNGQEQAGQDIAACSVTVDGVQVLNGNAAARPECARTVTTTLENASFSGLRPEESVAFLAQGNKLLDYGGLFSLGLQSGYRPRASAFVGVSATNVAFIDRNFAYSSTLSFSFATPLPFGKNFGAYGTQQATALKLAQSGIVRAGFEYELVANNTLLVVDKAYWDLVESLKVLQIMLEQKAILEQLRKRAQTYYKLGEINEYSMKQVDARLASTLSREALAWNGLTAASETLSNLLNGDVLELLLPVAYQDSLEQISPVDLKLAMRAALERNADIKRSETLLEEAQITLNHRLNQVKPDLVLSATVSFGQTDQVFGYPSLGNSLSNILNPDVRTISAGVTFRLPLGNVAAKAALSQARVGVMQARDQLTQSQNQAVQQLNVAMDALQSGLKQIELSRINMKLAEEAFEAATRRRVLNLVTEFELLEIQNDLLISRLNHIDALVQYRKNVARFMASQNLLSVGANQ